MSCSAPSTKLGEDRGIAYLPLRDGQKYIYRRQCGDRSEQFTWKLQFVEGDLKTPEFRVISEDAHDFFLRHQENAIVCLTENPPAHLREFPEGQLYLSTWLLDEATTGIFWEDEETGLRTAVAGFETVTTPAGTFDDCMKIVIQPTDILLEVLEARAQMQGRVPAEIAAELKDVSEIRVRWFARGVGLVKEEKGDCCLELISYKQK